MDVKSENIHTLPDNCVLIAGGGPVGLVTATVLAHHGVRSVVFERNVTTTKWPKMDLTNVRSMELFKRLELADELRTHGVPSHMPYTVLMTTGLASDGPITKWEHPSVEEFRKRIELTNDGTQPREPYQRISQSVFEAWMKTKCEEHPLVELRFGWKLETIKESPDGVEATIIETSTGQKHLFKSKYAVGCDGASSKARRSLEIPLDGGPTPVSFLLVHFKSSDLARLHKQGRFWHLFILLDGTFGGACICQDEKEIFTIHFPLAPGVDPATITSEEAIAKLFGGLDGPYKIKVDEILVRSTYQPSIAVARHFAGPELRIFLAGDAAHQNVPTGGYGMNTGLGDAFDIGWKLAAVINGYGKRGLLRSYEQERRPVALINVERSGVHMATHMQAVELLKGHAAEVGKQSKEGREVKGAIHKHYQEHDGENTDFGIEMGYRYSSVVCIPDGPGEKAPDWDPHTYVPTSMPGSRPPHVFLKDSSSIFDHLGKDFSLVDFGRADSTSERLISAARQLSVPLKHIRLPGEDHAEELWEKPLVLVRPDGHVSWRGESLPDEAAARLIMETAVGYHDKIDEETPQKSNVPVQFTMTEGMSTQVEDYKLQNMGEFQQ